MILIQENTIVQADIWITDIAKFNIFLYIALEAAIMISIESLDPKAPKSSPKIFPYLQYLKRYSYFFGCVQYIRFSLYWIFISRRSILAAVYHLKIIWNIQDFLIVCSLGGKINLKSFWKILSPTMETYRLQQLSNFQW